MYLSRTGVEMHTKEIETDIRVRTRRWRNINKCRLHSTKTRDEQTKHTRPVMVDLCM